MNDFIGATWGHRWKWTFSWGKHRSIAVEAMGCVCVCMYVCMYDTDIDDKDIDFVSENASISQTMAVGMLSVLNPKDSLELPTLLSYILFSSGRYKGRDLCEVLWTDSGEFLQKEHNCLTSFLPTYISLNMDNYLTEWGQLRVWHLAWRDCHKPSPLLLWVLTVLSPSLSQAALCDEIHEAINL